jgi:UDP-N-acetylglucosamine transferase subunit ALG13
MWGDTDLQIIHAAGTRLHEETLTAWRDAVGGDPDVGPPVRILDFIDDMSLAYAAADIAVCRAGATSIAELSALGVPAVLVPYPAATRDHQLHNARALATVGGAQVIEDHELTPASIVAALRAWLDDPGALATAARNARAFGRRDAADLVAAAIEEVVSPATVAPGLAIDRRRRATTTELPGVDDAAFEQAFADTARSVAETTDELRREVDTPEPADDDGAGGPRPGDDEAAPPAAADHDADADQPETP